MIELGFLKSCKDRFDYTVCNNYIGLLFTFNYNKVQNLKFLDQFKSINIC